MLYSLLCMLIFLAEKEGSFNEHLGLVVSKINRLYFNTSCFVIPAVAGSNLQAGVINFVRTKTPLTHQTPLVIGILTNDPI